MANRLTAILRFGIQFDLDLDCIRIEIIQKHLNLKEILFAFLVDCRGRWLSGPTQCCRQSSCEVSDTLGKYG